ncbi:MAG TPA: class I SAM-dependent methyltransferase [Marinilabiliales bacterium]|nr:class I SAM-dependent methyltransferase [Marinilabiliales bacterium]HBO74437.1 class I SAM-dependent methyltransferase [Marinilabiliales bacterium]HBX86757.1 class I SAM-dependent methyltransferase [Marinilabiliales bacterium]HBY51046.1 class I SAM-dependent methyltransferase [Marinilabiliales bacterium]HCC29074.1 class I SAM-dependent methyltransferase [Marinilabiliales bacterium]
MKTAFREKMFQLWYWYVSNIDKNAEVLFMNYGYANSEFSVNLEPADEPNRYSAQLYHLLGADTGLSGKDIAEIGCGRGGGLSYVVRTFSPATALGIDLNERAVRFCNQHYQHKGLTFRQGDAQNLPFINNASFDVILNVESSHRYPQMELFLNEVYRLLRPGGYFLYTDFRYGYEMPLLKEQLSQSGLKIEKEELITDRVVEALTADDARKRRLIKKLAPRFVHKTALNFAGAINSETYNQFANHQYQYYFYVLRKPS